MEAEVEQDPFAYIIKFCKQMQMDMEMEAEEEQEPTASQEAKLSNCPLARESDKFLDANNEHFEIKGDEIELKHIGGKSWFSRLHEAKDRHRNGGVRLLLSRKKIEEIDEFRFVDGEWEGRSGSGRQRFLPPSLKEKEEEKVKEKAEIAVLDSEDSVTCNSDAAGEAGTVSTVREIGGLLSNGVAKSDANNGNHELGENVEVPRVENSGQIEEDIANIAGKSCLKVASCIGGVDKAVRTPKDARKPKDSHGNGGVRSSRKDELRYVGSVVDGECEGRRGRRVGRSGRKPSLKGKEKEMEEKMSGLSLEEKEKQEEEKRSGLLDLLDILKSVFGDMDGGYDSEKEDVDILETAKSRGMTFPRPRWWHSDGDEEEGLSS